MTKSEQYLAAVRQADGFRRAIIEKIEIEGRSIRFCLLTDCAFSAEDIAFAQKASEPFVPQGYSVEVAAKKSVPADDLVERKVKELLLSHHPAAGALVRQEDIVCRGTEEKTVTLFLSPAERALVGNDVVDHLRALLEKSFCGGFRVLTQVREKKLEIGEEEGEEETYAPGCRYFPIEGFETLDGADSVPAYATYIADGMAKEGEMNLCGSISYVTEKETAKGKPFFQFTISDGTSAMRVVYFSRKATVDKIRELKVGDAIVCSGVNELFNGGLSFHVRRINYGHPPEGFVPEKRPSRSVPKQYHTVFPEPLVDYSQADMFGQEPLPEEFCRREFVVFDLETTGLNNNPSMGVMDRIIEIGAVKIRGGAVAEKFSTFVACPVKLSKEIVALTGIEDSMLVGAPDISQAILDFYKFTDRCELVGHNVMFDYKFISHYGGEQDICFDARLYDTVTIAQEQLRLSNYKLNTVAEHFGVTFQHHRAFDDALATAKIFIALIRMKKCLPN